MKLLLTLIYISLFVSTVLNAQVEFDEDKREFDVLGNYEVATGKSLDTKTLYKASINGFSYGIFDVGVERKIGKSFSLSLTSRLGLLSTLPIQIDGRYYPKHRSLINNGYGNNLNGFYISTGVGITILDFWQYDSNPRFYNSMSVGVQSRFLKNGIIDFSLGVIKSGSEIYVTPTIGAGFAFSKLYRKNEFVNARCNILKCFDERTYQLKIPLNRIIDISYEPDDSDSFVGLLLRMNFEHRLVQGLSLNYGVLYDKNWRTSRTTDDTKLLSEEPTYQVSNNLRWYFLKARSIAKGKSADNLSGLYVETDVALTIDNLYRFGVNQTTGRIEEGIYKLRYFDYGINAGYQTRLFKKLYFDVQLSWFNRETKILEEPLDLDFTGFFTRSGFRLGGLFEVGLLF